MYIEIRGAGFVNKGAELMLRAVVEHYAGRADVRFVVGADVGNYEDRARYGLYTRLICSRHGLRSRLAPLVLHRGIRHRYGIVAPADIAAVLDVSGYAYGDPWGMGPARDAVREFAAARRRGARIVLLPQALGPFSSPRLCRLFARLKELADAVYARDGVSYRHAVGCGGRSDHVGWAPDITHLVPGRLPSTGGLAPRTAVLVPSSMILQGDPARAGQYLQLTRRVCHRLKEDGLSPVLLLHERKRDRELVGRVYEAMGCSLPVRYEADPVHLKGILGSAAVVFASRYHALVSALSQGVPAIAVGWAHKYDELFADYEIPDFCLTLQEDGQRVCGLIDLLADDDAREAVRHKLRARAEAQKRKVEKMWKEVDHLLFP